MFVKNPLWLVSVATGENTWRSTLAESLWCSLRKGDALGALRKILLLDRLLNQSMGVGEIPRMDSGRLVVEKQAV